MKMGMLHLVMMRLTALGIVAGALWFAMNTKPLAYGIPPQGKVLVSSIDLPLLQFPEGITSWHGKVYVGTFNFLNPKGTRIFVFNAHTGKLLHTLGDPTKPGQALISNGAILGLTINHATGDLFAAGNEKGYIVRIHEPDSDHPEVSIYATYPNDAPASPGPEDMAFNAQGWLYASDSNNSRLYAIPPGGGKIELVVGPQGSGAKFSDHGLFAQSMPGAGLAPNGLVFGLDFRTLYAANTDTDSVIALEVGKDGQLTGKIRTLAEHKRRLRGGPVRL